MGNLPQRPRSHVLEKESRLFVERVLPTEWIVDSGQDYGIDLVVEIVQENNVTGAHFLMQLKSTDNLAVDRKGYISHSCETSTLQYFLQRQELVIYLVYDSKNKVGYWIWIKDFLRGLPSTSWKKQEKLTVKIPKKNVFNRKAIVQIKNRALQLHPKEKLVEIIASVNHPLYKYNLELNENAMTVSVLPKFPGTDKDIPVFVNLKLAFDDSREGKKASLDWDNVIKKGMSAKIDARFVKSIKTSDIFGPEMFFGDEFELDQLEIEPISRNIKFPLKIEILDANDGVITQIPFIELKEIRRGTDEVLFSNEGQRISLIFSILFKLAERKATLSFKSRSEQISVFEMREALTFHRQLSGGYWLQLVDLRTNKVLIRRSVFGEPVFKPSKKTIEISEKLALIQERTNVTFNWPGKITSDDINMLDTVVNIIKTGYSAEGDRFEFYFDKEIARQLSNRFSESKSSNLIFDSHEDRVLTLFGQELNLGSVRIFLQQAKPTEKTMKRFELLNQLPDNELVKVELDVENPGIIFQHHRWIPKKL